MAGSNSTLSLLIETRASGSNELSRLELALNRLADSSEKAGKRTEDAGKRAATTAKGISDSLRNLGDNPLGSAIAEIEKYSVSLGKVGGIAFGATAGVAALTVGAYQLVKGYAAAAQEQVNFATRLGVSIGQGQRWSSMARIAGVDASVLEGSTRLVAQALEDSTGRGARAAKALEQLGVASRTATGESRELGAVTSDVIDALAGVTSIVKRTALANAILGKSSRELQPLLANYKSLEDATKKLGIGLDAAGTKQLSGLAQQISIADLAYEQFKRNLAKKIAPVVIPIITTFSSALSDKPSPQAKAAIGAVSSLLIPGLGLSYLGEAGLDATKDFIDSRQPPRLANPPFAQRPSADLLRGQASSEFYTKKFAGGDDEIKAQIEELRNGDGKDILGTVQLRGLLKDSISVTGSAKDAAAAKLKEAEDKITSLEAQLKANEARRAADLEITKVRQEASLKLGYPDGLLPSDQKYIDFFSKSELRPDQKSQFGAAILPLAAQEYEQAVRKAGETGGLGALRSYLGDSYTPFSVKDLAGSDTNASFKTLRDQYEILRKREEFAKGISPSLASARNFDNTRTLNATLAGIDLDAARSGAPGSETNTFARQSSVRKAALQDEYKFQVNLIDDQYAYLDTVSKRDEDAERTRDAKKAELQKKNALDVSQLESELAIKRAEESKRLFEQGREFDNTRILNSNLASVQLQGLRLGSGSELLTASRENSVKKDAVNKEYEYQISLIDKEYVYLAQLAELDEEDEKERAARLLELKKKNALDLSQLEIELAQKVAEEQNKQREQGRQLAGSFFDAATTRKLPDFFKNYGLGIGKTIFQNGTSDIFAAAKYQVPGQGTIGAPSLLGKLLQGTPFGLDPLKGLSDPLRGATDLNTAATNANTAAIDRWTASIRGPGGTNGDSPRPLYDFSSPGLGSENGISLPNAFLGGGDGISLPGAFLGAADAAAIASSPSAIAQLAKVAAAIPGVSGIRSAGSAVSALKSIGGSINGFNNQVFFGRAGSPVITDENGDTYQADPGSAGISGRALLGAGVQVGGGVLGLINGLKTGGARGDIGAAGGAAAAVGGILPLLSSSLALAGPIGAGVGAVLGLVSSFFGDPKQLRQKAISKTAENYQFYQPEAINLSEGVNGGFSDYDKSGNVRSSNISPYPSVSEPYFLFRSQTLVPGTTNSQFGGQNGNVTINNNISALDGQSVADLLMNQHQAIADGFLLNMDRGNTGVVDRLRQNL